MPQDNKPIEQNTWPTFEEYQNSDAVKRAEMLDIESWKIVIEGELPIHIQTRIVLRIINRFAGKSIERRKRFFEFIINSIQFPDEWFGDLFKFLALSEEAWKRLLKALASFEKTDNQFQILFEKEWKMFLSNRN